MKPESASRYLDAAAVAVRGHAPHMQQRLRALQYLQACIDQRGGITCRRPRGAVSEATQTPTPGTGAQPSM